MEEKNIDGVRIVVECENRGEWESWGVGIVVGSGNCCGECESLWGVGIVVECENRGEWESL